jgi:poly-D-alanine transfer protein DltD
MKNQLVKFHIYPFLFSLALFLLVISFSGNCIFRFDKVKRVSLADKNFFLDYSDGAVAEDFVRKAMVGGNQLIVIGSSEMTYNNLQAIPYNFFNKMQNIPCLGLGHAGNQTFCIYSQLCAMCDCLKNARLTIVLSPSWFNRTGKYGTSLHVFLDFNHERFLYNTYYNPRLPERYKQYVGRFIGDNITDIESPSAILKLFYYSHLCQNSDIDRIIYSPFKNMYESYCSSKIKYTDKLWADGRYEAPLVNQVVDAGSKSPFAYPRRINWDSLYQAAAKDFEKICNNTLGVEDNLYQSTLSLAKTDHKPPLVADENRELKDLSMLLKLLKYYHTDALFVLGPYNPLAYEYTKQLLPTMKSVTDSVSKYGFTCYNMYTADKEHYIKGTLLDLTHLGNVGWYKVDSAIYEHFKTGPNE